MPVNSPEEYSKKPSGRPKKYGEGVDAIRRNITVTNPGWEGLDKIVENNSLSSRSELVEQIGRKTLHVLSHKQLLDFENTKEIAVYERLISLTKKTSYMRSIISFARIVMLRTGISEKLSDDVDKLIEDVIKKSMTFVAIRDYVYPGHLVNSAMADIRWLVFKLLLSNTELGEISDEDIDLLGRDVNKSWKTEIDEIFNSIFFFSRSFPLEYQIYEMRMMESLNWAQIERILNLRGNNLTEKDIRDKNHDAVGAIRDAWHGIHFGLIEIKDYEDLDREKLKERMESTLYLSQKYYDLINNEQKFSVEQFREWEKFLLKSMRQPKLDLLLPEIHHSWVHKHENMIDMETYKEKSTTILDGMDIRFNDYLQIELDRLKQKLRFCGNKRQDIQDTLMSMIPNIPKSHFLGDRINLDY